MDRIVIDHVNNKISIDVHSISLGNLDDKEICDWLIKFIQNVKSTKIEKSLVKQ